MSTMTTMRAGFNEVVNGFNAVMPHASKDDVSPVITGVYMDADGLLVATDRYTVGVYELQPKIEGDGFAGAILPIEAVKWIAAMRPLKLAMGKHEARNYTFLFTFDSSVDSVRIELGWGEEFQIAEQSASFILLKGNFPPVLRLFPDETAKFGVSDHGVSLNMTFLGRIGVATKWLGDRNNCAKFRFLVTDIPNKPGPVVVNVGDRFRALIQPNLALR